MLGNAPPPPTRIAVVGGGIIGVAVARELLTRYPGTSVVVFEKETSLGRHQTGHNSGVVHAGLYYQPETLKAELCARGAALLREYCADRAIAFKECGKLVVAVHPGETLRLEGIEESARANRVPGLRRIGSRELRELEPHAAGVAALHSPRTAITDFVAVTESLAADVRRAGGEVRLATEVLTLTRTPSGAKLTMRSATGTAEEHFGALVLCPGLQADRLAAQADGGDGPRIVPFRGEYLAVKQSRRNLVRGLIYPVPDPRYPFLGVHFTTRVDGRLDIGPNAVLAASREGYRRSSFSLADMWDVAKWPGSWRLAREHWRAGAAELRTSMSRTAFLQTARRYVPAIGPDDIEGVHYGVRAQAVERDGTLVDDFQITQTDAITAVRNAPSPAATSSLAIAEYVVARMPGPGG